MQEVTLRGEKMILLSAKVVIAVIAGVSVVGLATIVTLLVVPSMKRGSQEAPEGLAAVASGRLDAKAEMTRLLPPRKPRKKVDTKPDTNPKNKVIKEEPSKEAKEESSKEAKNPSVKDPAPKDPAPTEPVEDVKDDPKEKNPEEEPTTPAGPPLVPIPPGGIPAAPPIPPGGIPAPKPAPKKTPAAPKPKPAPPAPDADLLKDLAKGLKRVQPPPAEDKDQEIDEWATSEES